MKKNINSCFATKQTISNNTKLIYRKKAVFSVVVN
jgi:hypothetical protein